MEDIPQGDSTLFLPSYSFQAALFEPNFALYCCIFVLGGDAHKSELDFPLSTINRRGKK